MKKICIALMVFAGIMTFAACGKDSNSKENGENGGENGGGTPTSEVRTDFLFGSDVSWVTEMENDGKRFYNASGTEQDLFKMFGAMGQKIIRLRIWVDPDGGWCGYEDVLAKAKRAQDAGMSVMLDFHYSDFFADPGKQTPPASWKGKIHAELVQAVSSYTKEILEKLKLNRINPTHIQIGNETRNGMLWPDGQLWNNSGDISGGWARYIELSNAGYTSAKEVFPGSKVFVHLNHAYEDNTWWLDKFISGGGKTDMIGLSHYPQVDQTGAGMATVNQEALDNMKVLNAKTGLDIIVVETGVKSSDPLAGATGLKSFINGIYELPFCKGILYWEPEVYGGWKPAKYNELGWNAYDMGAFTEDGAISDVIKLFIN